MLQGGHHPELGLKFYVDLFRELKGLYPNLKLHSLGPPEIAHITKLEKSTHTEVFKVEVYKVPELYKVPDVYNVPEINKVPEVDKVPDV